MPFPWADSLIDSSTSRKKELDSDFTISPTVMPDFFFPPLSEQPEEMNITIIMMRLMRRAFCDIMQWCIAKASSGQLSYQVYSES
jgi:hypothetical protein